eukprot:791869_1
MEQPFISTSSFGESQFGKRLEYEQKTAYRDPIFAVCYIIHVIVVIAAGVYLWISEYPSIEDSDNDTSLQISFNINGVIVAVITCIIIGILFGICWLQVMKRFAGTIIKGMLFFNIGIWIIVVLVGVIVSVLSLVVIGAIKAGIYCLWTWCIWSRIPFASALLSISSTIINKFQGTIFISLSVIVFNILWMIIWASCCISYLIVATKETKHCPCPDPNNPNDCCTTSGSPNNFIIFLLLISLYWGFQVNKNISHTTTCGVAATWYFSTVIDHKPTPAAFKRTMTTSFGSVCLGSLIVAFLQAVRAMLRASKNSRGILTCIALCLLGCIERLIRYFNKYAYAQCAIYGTSFIQSAKATWQLFMSRGILAIINDDLTGMAIGCGALIGGVVSAGVGFGIGYLFYKDDTGNDTYPIIPIYLAIYGFLMGLVLCHCVLTVLASCVIALFVCYAEDPAAMNQNRPEEYNRITQAKPTWGDIYRNHGGRNNVATQPTQQQIMS